MTPNILKKNNTNLMVFVLSAFVITASLFFIDEGYYNFKWAKNPFSWIVFAMYAIPIFGFQLLIYNLLPNKTGKPTKYVTSILIGSIISVTLTIGIFYLFG